MNVEWMTKLERGPDWLSHRGEGRGSIEEPWRSIEEPNTRLGLLVEAKPSVRLSRLKEAIKGKSEQKAGVGDSFLRKSKRKNKGIFSGSTRINRLNFSLATESEA